jgi:hypothetical protein
VRLLVKFAFLLTLLLATATGAWAADGRLLSYEGDVRVNGQPVTSETLLNSQDTIATAEGASARIVLADNSVLDLDGGTEIRLSDYSYEASEPAQGKSDIDVIEGSLRYVSGLIAKENAKNISFSAGNSTIGVRGSFTGIEVDGVVINVESMIGEAVLIRETDDGQTDTILVPTGQVTVTDETTGQATVQPSTSSNSVNRVVRAIAAVSPDAASGSTGEGCSRGNRPLRRTARPDYDAESQAEIQALLRDLTEGELMMVIAVLNNNARHLCIDYTTIDSTIGEIATVRPEVAGQVVFVAALIDPANAEQFAETASTSAPEQSSNIQQATEAAKRAREDFGTDAPSQPSDSGESPVPKDTTQEEDSPPADTGDSGDTDNEVPPGGGEPPSPE